MPKYLNLSLSGSTSHTIVRERILQRRDRHTIEMNHLRLGRVHSIVNPFFSAYLRSLFSIVCISPGSLVVIPRSSARIQHVGHTIHSITSHGTLNNALTDISAHVIDVQREKEGEQRAPLFDTIRAWDAPEPSSHHPSKCSHTWASIYK